MLAADYSGQTDIFDPRAFTWDINLVGLGGLGSAVSFPTVKIGLNTTLHLWDDDLVELHNVPAQLIYSRADVGRPKVEAAKEFLERFCEPGCTIVAHQERVTESTVFDGVVMSGVDSMAARKAIWESVRWNYNVPLYLDGRMGGEQVTLLAVNPCDPDEIDYYENPDNAWLLSDDESSTEPCAARTVIHPPMVLAGMYIAQLTRFFRGLPTRRATDFHVRETQVITY